MIKSIISIQNSSIIILTFTIVLSLTSCSKKSEEDPTVEKNIATVKKYMDEMNKGNENYLDEYLADNYSYHGPNGVLDKAGFKAQHHMIITAFSDINITAKIIFGEADKVATRWIMHGKNTGEFNGLPPTGKEFTVTGIIISRFVDGKEVEAWEEVNQISMMQQLGLMNQQ